MIISVTEEEAKTKRCQEGYAASPGAALNPTTDYVHQSFAVPSMQSPVAGGAYAATATTAAPMTAPIFCLGSACMAWRWKRGSYFEPMAGNLNVLIEHEGKGEYSETHGYCGKAGPL